MKIAKRIISVLLLVILLLCNAVYANDTQENENLVDKVGRPVPSNYFAICESMQETRALATIYESESNDSMSTADRTYNDYDSFGTISSIGDVDWWRVSFSSNGSANFWLGDIPSGCDYDMELYDGNGYILEASYNSGNNDELISSYTVYKNTYYYIRIYSYNNSSSNYYKFRTKIYSFHGYAGVNVSSSNSNRGIEAVITTPSTFPSVGSSGESVWVSTSKDTSGAWIQVGAKYYNGYSSFNNYVEYYIGGLYTRDDNIGTHSLNSSKTYRVEYLSSDSTWHAYMDNIEVATSSLVSSTMGVQAQAETHDPTVEMGPFSFSDVIIKNTNNTWVNNTKMPTADPLYATSGTATNYTVYSP